jgi:cell division protein FtsB
VQFGSPAFVLVIIAMSYLAWIITTAIRARHGYPLDSEWGGEKIEKVDSGTEALRQENERLKSTVGRLEERLKVLERIATDPARQLADEIDKLG